MEVVGVVERSVMDIYMHCPKCGVVCSFEPNANPREVVAFFVFEWRDWHCFA